MPNLNNTRNISCWTCKHFQESFTEFGELNGIGECRAIPPLQVAANDTNEPVFAYIGVADCTWCSAWMQRRAGLGEFPGRQE
jgi:hypothetical protein